MHVSSLAENYHVGLRFRPNTEGSCFFFFFQNLTFGALRRMRSPCGKKLLEMRSTISFRVYRVYRGKDIPRHCCFRMHWRQLY